MFDAAAAAPWHIVGAIAVGLAFASAMLFSVLPAWQATRRADPAALRSRQQTGSRGSKRIGQIVVAGELALAFVLLVGGLLAGRSWQALSDIDPGFDAERVVAATLPVTGTNAGQPGRKQVFYEQVLAGVQAIPSVRAASLVNHVPLAGDVWRFSVATEGGAVADASRQPRAAYRVAAPGYFDTVGATLLGGREFEAEDRADAEPVAIINQTFAERHFAGAKPLGRRVRLGGESEPWRSVVGVVGDLRQQDWRNADAAVFVPFAQDELFRESARMPFSMTLVVRTSGEFSPLINQIRSQVAELDPFVPVANVTLLKDAVDATLFRPKWTARILSGFGFAGLALATLGIYALVAFGAAQRRREFGIRLAVGASPSRLRRTVHQEGLVLAVVGLAMGATCAWIVTSTWNSWLYAVAPGDTIAWGVAALALVVAVMLAVDAPARRAAKSGAAVLSSGE